MIAERFAGHSGVKYLRSVGCERVQFKNQVCNPELGGLPAKSETLRLNSGVSWPRSRQALPNLDSMAQCFQRSRVSVQAWWSSRVDYSGAAAYRPWWIFGF